MSYMDALLRYIPEAQCAINEETGEILDWQGPGEPPTDEQLRVWHDELFAELPALTWEANV